MVCLGLILVMGQAGSISRMFDKWLVARGVLETIANLSFIFALGFIAFADLTAIVQTCPLFVLLGAWAFRGERLGGLRVGLILLGIAGAMLVAQPGTGAVSPLAGLAFLTAIASAVRDLLTPNVPRGMPPLVAALTVIAVLTLTGLEIVLGIDNVIFISILAGKLPQAQQVRARQLGLMLALVTRILLLGSISWLMSLTKVLFVLPVLNADITGKSLILLLGGLFLIGKSVVEVHEKLEGEDGHSTAGGKVASFKAVIVQILILDVVFSLDSVITAVGMANELWIMITAVVVALGVMLVFAGAISDFVNRHPTLKMLALSFLILIGVTLVGEALGQHIPKGYIYFSMAFAFGVEMLNLRLRAKSKPVALHQPYR